MNYRLKVGTGVVFTAHDGDMTKEGVLTVYDA